MGKATDITTVGASLYFLPVQARISPSPDFETDMTCARACVTVTGSRGQTATGWGETPLSVQQAWPGTGPCEDRLDALKQFCVELTELWGALRLPGHPIELGMNFLRTVLPGLLTGFNQRHRRGKEPMPLRAGLLCCSPFDLAVHDAYGQLMECPVYATYSSEFMSCDLAHFLQPATGSGISFQGKFPADFLAPAAPEQLAAWHLVDLPDPLEENELTGQEQDDGYPHNLVKWIHRDGLKCLNVKLRANDAEWDYARLVRVGQIGATTGADWLSTVFNGTVTQPDYVNAILDRLRDEHPRIYGMILFVQQPFPLDPDKNPIDVHSVSSRKPLFLDEGADGWRSLRRGRSLGWSGVMLKTSTTQTSAVLSACWARAHGMGLMVQDLPNPMLAQIPHVLLAAHTGTIMGVETNAMQFFPEASRAEAAVHPGLYQRRSGKLTLASVKGPGFGYRMDEIKRDLPEPAARSED